MFAAVSGAAGTQVINQGAGHLGQMVRTSCGMSEGIQTKTSADMISPYVTSIKYLRVTPYSHY